MKRTMFTLAFGLLGLAMTPSLPAQTKGEGNLVAPKQVRKAFSDGKHNAFTAMIRFRDQLYLAFRNGANHNSPQADLIVLRSPDGKEWKEAFRLDAGPDDRDPQFLVVGKRLFLYDQVETGPKLKAFAIYTEDGETWSKPQPVYEPDFIIWKPCRHGDKFYCAAHKYDNTNGGKNRTVHLIVSDDGLNWKKISTIRGGAWESETTLHFDAKGHATAFLRQKYGSPPCSILEADAPYTSWKARAPEVNHFSGHSAHTFRGVSYLLSRTMDYGKKTAGSMIYTFEGGKLTPYCRLPAGGDCAYLEAVENGDDMLVSYYSTHEGTTDIYVATVPLKK